MATLKEVSKKKAAAMPTNVIDDDMEPRLYEIALLYPYPMGQKEEAELLKNIDQIFAEAKAKLLLKDVWGRRGLAYKIGGFNEGVFIIYYFEMDPAAVKDVDQQLRILKGVLRHMIVKPPKNYQIVPYAAHYQKWKDQEKLMQEKASMEREERLKKQVVDKAMRQSKKEEAEVKKAAPMTGEAITEELDKLISDKDLEL